MNCLSCDNNKGYYLIQGTNNCINKNEIKEGEYLDNTDNIIKKCNIACKTCSSKEIYNELFDVINCNSCNINKGYYSINGTNICTNNTNKYIFNDIIYNNIQPFKIIPKCHKNCLTCGNFTNDENDMNCLSCNNTQGFYMVEGKHMCVKLPYPGYYLENEVLKKCYKDCLTCSQGPSFNDKGILISMNCDTCKEYEGFYLLNKSRNCSINNDIYSDICPEDKPILKKWKMLFNILHKRRI
jgi:hypothetical protein